MFTQSITTWAKSLLEKVSKPQSYGSALESYIIRNNPQSAGDVDRLAREYDLNKGQYLWGRGL